MRNLGLALWMLLALLLQGCRPDDTTRCFVSCTPSPEGWEAGEALVFPVDTLREAGQYVLHVGVRTSAAEAYPYCNLALRLEEDFGRTRRTRLLRLCLTDEHGDVSGHGVSRFRYEFPADTLRLAEGTAGTVTIVHDMRRQLLPGLTDVSVRLERIGR